MGAADSTQLVSADMFVHAGADDISVWKTFCHTRAGGYPVYSDPSPLWIPDLRCRFVRNDGILLIIFGERIAVKQ